jgi:putative redox protein
MPGHEREVTAVWKGGLAFEAVVPSGLSVRMDNEPGVGFSPTELVLVGLAGCTGMDVAEILRKKRQEVTGIEVTVRGTRAPDHPRRFTAIHVVYAVTGRQVDAEAVRRSIELSQTKYCSVAATLREPAPITTEFQIHETDQLANGHGVQPATISRGDSHE